MTQEMAVAKIMEIIKAPPALSAIPFDTPFQRLRVRHGGYDIRGALADHNVVLPLDGLRQLQAEGNIGALADTAYAFMGVCSQIRLLKQSGPQWVALLQEKEVEALLLVPV
jgi:D-proline reductase (dithiol) PrdB